MDGGEGRGREGAHLLEHRGDLVGQVVGGVVVTRVEAADVAAGAETATLAAQQEGTGPTLGGLGVDVGDLLQVSLGERVEGLRVVEDDLGETVLEMQINH